MKIKLATMSGADNKSNIRSLASISRDYEFVEWGILFSEKRFGSPRYPDLEWLNTAEKFLENNEYVNYSIHLCGKSIKNVIVNNLNIGLINKAKRIQLNLNEDTLYFSSKIIDFIVNNGKNNIIQMNGINNKVCINHYLRVAMLIRCLICLVAMVYCPILGLSLLISCFVVMRAV